jgi:phage gpG-like protein
MSDDTVTINVKGLDQLLKALKAGPPIARVGILGDKTARSGDGSFQTNAEIGAAHEFGTSKMPARSFLRVPISQNLQKEMENSGALDKKTLNEVVKQGSVLPWVKKIAILAEGIVADAFDTGGFGKWPGWKNPNYTNNSGQLLVDTKQLRDSITSEVKE